MNVTSGTVATIGLVLGASLFAGCGTDARDRAPAEDTNAVVERAPAYVGDPWEKRYRQQFWADQHIHDSWNRCHLGENAPRPTGCDGTSLTPRG